MLTDFEIEYMFNIMENDLKTAREHVMYLVRNAIANGMAEELE